MKLRVLGWVVGVGALFLPVFPDPPLQTGVYVQSVTANSAVIARIEAGRRALTCEVSDLEGAVVARVTGEPRRWQAFPVDGLRAGHEYRYTVSADGEVVDAGRFETAPVDDAAPVRFAVVGDSGGQPWWYNLQRAPIAQVPIRAGWLPAKGTVQAIADAMAAERPDFWVHVGDVIYPRGDYRYFAAGFFTPFADLLRSASFFPVVGNHDMDGDNARPFLRNFHLPTNDWTGDERLFSTAWGGVRLIGLDLQGAMTPEHPALAYAERALAAATEPWIVIAAHYPYYSSSRHGDRTDLQELLLPLLVRYRVDLMVVGHDHNYQRFGDPHDPRDPNDDVVLVVSGGGGKSLYDLKPHDRLRQAHKGYEYCVVEVRGLQLTLQAKTVTGEILDTVVLDKAARIEAGTLTLDPGGSARDRRIEQLR